MRPLLAAVAALLLAAPGAYAADTPNLLGPDLRSDGVQVWVPSERAGASYRVGTNRRWPRKTITYYNGIKERRYQIAIRDGARAWNRSGARIRLVAASKRKAKIQIARLKPGFGTRGYASIGYVPRNGLMFHPESGRPVKGNRMWLYLEPRDGKRERAAYAAVVAHEFGHNLGLDHEDRKCATMNSVLWQSCDEPTTQPWLYRCRLLERDDVSGARRMYGGRVEPMGPEHCEQAPAPLAPTGLTLASTPDYSGGTVTGKWTPGARDVASLATIQPGSCDTNPAAARQPARLEDGSAYFGYQNAGNYCVTVWGSDAYGRTSAGYAQAWINVVAAPPY